MGLSTQVRIARAALLAGLLASLVLATTAAGATPTKTTLAAPPSPVWGQPLVITATVTDDPDTGARPTGSVRFTLDGLPALRVVRRLTVKAKKGRTVSVADSGWTVHAVRRTPRRPSVRQTHGRL